MYDVVAGFKLNFQRGVRTRFKVGFKLHCAGDFLYHCPRDISHGHCLSFAFLAEHKEHKNEISR
jgi:hypothetical protein